MIKWNSCLLKKLKHSDKNVVAVHNQELKAIEVISFILNFSSYSMTFYVLEVLKKAVQVSY